MPIRFIKLTKLGHYRCYLMGGSVSGKITKHLENKPNKRWKMVVQTPRFTVYGKTRHEAATTALTRLREITGDTFHTLV